MTTLALDKLRNSGVYAITIAAGGLGAMVLGAVLLFNDARGDLGPFPAKGDTPSYAVARPATLDELQASAKIIVEGQVVKHVKTEQISFGNSSPLGEQRRVIP